MSGLGGTTNPVRFKAVGMVFGCVGLWVMVEYICIPLASVPGFIALGRIKLGNEANLHSLQEWELSWVLACHVVIVPAIALLTTV